MMYDRTGKTSMIKALAHHTKRSIVNVPPTSKPIHQHIKLINGSEV